MDSASDELLACELMRGCGGLTPQSTPNLKCVIRDATHAARRVTAKPEKADPFLQEIHNKLISSKASISQILHNSTILGGPRFAARIKELDDHIGIEVRNVRACRHRNVLRQTIGSIRALLGRPPVGCGGDGLVDIGGEGPCQELY